MVMTHGPCPRGVGRGLILCLTLAPLIVMAAIGDEPYKLNPKCCTSQLMDSPGYVMIETEVALPLDTAFTAVITTFCTPFRANLQVWHRDVELGPNGREQYSFEWEQELRPDTKTMGSQTKGAIQTFSQPITFTEDHRLAIYAPESYTVPIPFDFDDSDRRYSFYLSTAKFDKNYVFTVGEKVYLGDLLWPRSFRPYIGFCSDPACLDIYPASADSPPRFVMGPPGPPGPPGPQGVAGQNCALGGNDQLPGGGAIQCEVPQVTVEVAKTGRQVQELEEKVDIMTRTLDSIFNSNTLTGICPINTMPGDYGLGSCYVFLKDLRPMGTAHIRCRDDFGGILVKIDSEREENFLKDQILKMPEFNLTRSLKFWTSGVLSYQGPQPEWVWYNEPKNRQTIIYTNWKRDIDILPKEETNVCMALEVDEATTRSVWVVINCSLQNYYICEIPKKCL